MGKLMRMFKRKRTQGKKTGRFEISLDEYDLDTTYKYFSVTTGDSNFDKDGREIQTSVAQGRRYKVNAGIRRTMSGVVLYGRMWYDDDEGGIIGTGEDGVPNAYVSLFWKAQRQTVSQEGVHARRRHD
mmetsp:Transcript_15335/g.27717  ORF Transcript_15335/g.27717 Transcript_15335/m.27717 type:complete len:128 (-) Transcript_15335:791-1174(-)